MSYGRPSWIAAALIGEEATRDRPWEVRSQTALFGSTSGPFGGLGGAAMTSFTITELRAGNLHLYFADEQFFGWWMREPLLTDGTPTPGEKPTPTVAFPHLRHDLPGLNRDSTTCPVPIHLGTPETTRPNGAVTP